MGDEKEEVYTDNAIHLCVDNCRARIIDTCKTRMVFSKSIIYRLER